MTIQLGSLTVYSYGLALAVGAALCLVWTAQRIKKAGMPADTAAWLACLAIPLCVLFSRLSYCLIRLQWFLDQGIGWFFRFHEGGFFLYGTIAGAMLACLIAARVTKQSAGRVMDCAAAPSLLMLFFARLAEGLVGQGYGWSISDWFSVEAFDAEEYTGMSLFHLEDADFFCRWPFAVENEMYGEFYWAVYMIEALIAIILCVVLIRTAARRPGWIAVKALLMVAAMQLLGESLRQDAVLRWGFVRAGQILGAITIAGILLLCCLTAKRKTAKQTALAWVAVFAFSGLFMAMEFALEKKIVFLESMPMDVCYVIMALACVGLIRSVLPMWRRSGIEA